MPIGVYRRKIRSVLRLIGPSIVYIPLTKNQFAVIDVDDIELVAPFNWSADWSNGMQGYYAIRSFMKNGRCIKQRMHELLMGKIDGHTIDHKNPERTLDNRRANMRFANPTEQARNRRIYRNNTSGHKGVSLYKPLQKWVAHIRIKGRLKSLGYFESLEEAKKAYNCAAREHFGEFARSA